MTNEKTFLHSMGTFFQKVFFLCQMIAEDPDKFKALVQESLRRQVAAINSLADVGKLISKNFQIDDEQKMKYYRC